MKRINYFLSYLLLFSLLGGLLSQCKKKDSLNLDTSVKLDFSADTILFDTIFTTVGSTTHRFKIYNTTNQRINIANIWLEQETQSMFRINVDGIAGVSFQNVEIPAKDSLFVFVEVTIDPNNANSPMVVEDKIHFVTNGNQQQVVLTAWGQDAYFHVREIISANETWNNDKPHVIYGYCAVDSAVTLTIPAGTNVYAHSNSMLFIYKGSLQCQGTYTDLVTFQQDRLEDFILSSPDSVQGQWRGIRFFEPLNSQLSHTYIKNALIGIQVDTLTSNHKVKLNAVQVHNSSYANLLTQGGNIEAVNCLFGNSPTYSAFVSIGGTVSFEHCTFGNYWQGQRNTPLLVIKNYYTDNVENVHYRPFIQVNISNSIIFGDKDNEFILDTLSTSIAGVAIPNVSFNNSLFKSEEPVNNPLFFSNCFLNSSPDFISPQTWDFHILENSFAKGKASPSLVIRDLDGVLRGTPATIGCFE